MRRTRTRSIGRSTPSPSGGDKGSFIAMQTVLSIILLAFVLIVKAAGKMPSDVKEGMSTAIEADAGFDQINDDLWDYISGSDFLSSLFGVDEATGENGEPVFNYNTINIIDNPSFNTDIVYVEGKGWQYQKSGEDLVTAPVFAASDPGDTDTETADNGGEILTGDNSMDYTTAAGGDTDDSAVDVMMGGISLDMDLMTPVSGVVTSKFGSRVDPLVGGTGFHHGVDIGAPLGTPIYAAADGVVSDTGSSEIYGRYIKIEHAFGVATFYGHCQRIIVKKGDKVKAGQKIATVGNTGNSTGSHLHFQVTKDGVYVDPEKYIKL